MTSSAVRGALCSLVAVPLLLAGCSSADTAAPQAAAPSANATASSAATSSSAAVTSSAAAGEDERKETFCREVPGLLTDVSADLQGVYSAPETAPQQLAEAVDRLSAVQPPAELADRWTRLVDAFAGMRDLLGQADLTDRAANADLAPRLQELQTELVASGTAIDDYGKASC